MADNKSQSTPQDKPNKKTLSPEELKRYYDLMEAQDLLELEIRHKDFFLRLTRKRPAGAVAPPAAGAVPPPAAPAAKAQIPEEQNQFHSIASPLAGVFYRAPSPKSDAFVKEGDKVAYGGVLCIVEAMKVMNEIRADRPCVIRKILVENGKPVSAGQNLFLVDPAS